MLPPMSAEPATPQGEGLEVGALVKGAAAGLLASLVESLVVVIPFMSGTPRTQAEVESMGRAVLAAPGYLATDLVGSLLCMVLGGYVSAVCAGRDGARHGAITGAAMLLVVGGLALVSIVLSGVQVPPWYTATSLLLAVPAAALGGSLRRTATDGPPAT